MSGIESKKEAKKCNMIKEAVSAHNVPDLSFALIVSFLFLVVAGITSANHEMWRDELQSWLISRDSSSPLAIFHNIRYEGHPFLWFLLIWPFTRITDSPEVIQLVNVLFAAAAIFVIGAFAPVSRWARGAVAFGYFPLYEYGSIARNYAIGLLALVSFCAIFPHRRKKPLVAGVLLFLAANASLHACILAVAAVVVLALELLRYPPEPSSRASAWTGIGIACGGIALSIFQMIPPADTGFAAGWNFTLDGSVLEQVLQTITNAYLPLRKTGPDFWESGLFASVPLYDRYTYIGGLIFFTLASLSLIRRPAALAYYLTGSLGLLLFFYIKYSGFIRHHGFLFISFCTAVWLARTMNPIALPKPLNAAGLWAERCMAVLAPIILTAQIAGATIAVAAENKYVFSAAKSTANVIRQNKLDSLPLVAGEDFMTVAVIGYLNKNRVFYPSGRRWGSYIIWDKLRDTHYYVWRESIFLARELHSPVVVVIDEFTLKNNPPPVSIESILQLVACRKGEIVPTESFCVFLLGTAALIQQ